MLFGVLADSNNTFYYVGALFTTLVHLRQVHPLVGTAFLLYPRSLLYYYSPTEHAEFTEPSAAMFSHGYHRCTQMVMVR